jgi:ribonuclease R
MKQARYSERNEGHFGLAANHYAHFTSPIRRYPDLVVHRLSARALIDEAKLGDGVGETLPLVARQSSDRERVAVAAERDSIELKKVEFMERHLGDTFEGTIAGVRAFGFFVLLDAFYVEGLVHVSSLDDDYYEYVEERYMLLGTRTRRQFRLGDRVRVQVATVDQEERRIDFALLETLTAYDEGRDRPPRKARRGAAGSAKKGIRKKAEKPKNREKMKKKRRIDGQRKGRGKR